MDTPPHSATIGIDVSKDTFVAAVPDAQTQEFPNTAAGVGTFLRYARDHGLPAAAPIGAEATGVYHLDLCRTLHAYGHTPAIVNRYVVTAAAVQAVVQAPAR